MPTPLIYLLIATGATLIGILFFWPESGLFWRWRHHRELSERVLREDALKHLFQSQMDGEKPNLHSLAGALHVSENEAANILSGMQARELIETPGNEIRLTSAGRDYALRITRAHRLYERFLADETGYKEAEWHSQAHIHEHHMNPEEVTALAARLGNPTHDPHGDPIPSANGDIVYPHNRIPLTALQTGKTARIIHLEDEPEIVYAQLVAEGLHVGQEVHLLEVSPQRVRFWSDGDEHVLAPLMAANIGVIPTPEDALQEKPVGEPLTVLKPGQEGRVLSFSPRLRKSERRRFLDLGLLPGTTISAEMTSASGDPVAYRIRDSLIALRKSQFDLIYINPPEKETNQ